MGRETLLFRCDANSTIGVGHIMRCLSLAQFWENAGGRSVFAAVAPTAVQDRLRSENISLILLNQTPGSFDDAIAIIGAAKEAGAEWVVVDGDHFDPEYLRSVQAGGSRVLLVDDFAGRKSFPADLIVNPNLGASEDVYRKTGVDGPLLLGERYVPLRREFLLRGNDRRFPEFGARVLISLGGSDPEDLAPRIVEALRKINSLQLTVVAGAAYEHWSELERSSTPKVRTVFNPSHMPELMEQADLAIVAAGGTLWELLYMRCAVLSYARNPVQARVVKLLADQGVVCDMGDTQYFDGLTLATAVAELAASKALRERMANSGLSRIDGNGASRVVAAIQGYTPRR